MTLLQPLVIWQVVGSWVLLGEISSEECAELNTSTLTKGTFFTLKLNNSVCSLHHKYLQQGILIYPLFLPSGHQMISRPY